MQISKKQELKNQLKQSQNYTVVMWLINSWKQKLDNLKLKMRNLKIDYFKEKVVWKVKLIFKINKELLEIYSNKYHYSFVKKDKHKIPFQVQWKT